jgi:hypothetical protein
MALHLGLTSFCENVYPLVLLDHRRVLLIWMGEASVLEQFPNADSPGFLKTTFTDL